MNSEQLKAVWDEFKGTFQQEFGKLTDDDLMRSEGDLNKLSAKVEKAYGLTKDEARQKLKTYLNQWDGNGQKVTSLLDKAANMLDDVKVKKHDVEEYVHKHPVKSVVGAAAVGAAVGAIISRL